MLPFVVFIPPALTAFLAGMQLVPAQLPLSSPPNLQAFSYALSHALSSSDFSSSTSAIHTYTEPIYHHPHANDPWEVIHESRIFKPIIPGTYKRPKMPKMPKQTKLPTKIAKVAASADQSAHAPSAYPTCGVHSSTVHTHFHSHSTSNYKVTTHSCRGDS